MSPFHINLQGFILLILIIVKLWCMPAWSGNSENTFEFTLINSIYTPTCCSEHSFEPFQSKHNELSVWKSKIWSLKNGRGDVRGLVGKKEVRHDLYSHTMLLPRDLLLLLFSNTWGLIMFLVHENNPSFLVYTKTLGFCIFCNIPRKTRSLGLCCIELEKFHPGLRIEIYNCPLIVSEIFCNRT